MSDNSLKTFFAVFGKAAAGILLLYFAYRIVVQNILTLAARSFVYYVCEEGKAFINALSPSVAQVETTLKAVSPKTLYAPLFVTKEALAGIFGLNSFVVRVCWYTGIPQNRAAQWIIVIATIPFGIALGHWKARDANNVDRNALDNSWADRGVAFVWNYSFGLVLGPWQ